MRNAYVAERHAEKNLKWTPPSDAVQLKLHGRADRIDILKDGTCEILDFKTGQPPEAKDIRKFLAPQLLVEAAMVMAEGFEGHEAAPVSAISYVQVSSNPEAFTPADPAFKGREELEEAAFRMMNLMQSRAAAFLFSDHLPMHARIMPDTSRTWPGPYDHLARVDEWTGLNPGGDE